MNSSIWYFPLSALINAVTSILLGIYVLTVNFNKRVARYLFYFCIVFPSVALYSDALTDHLTEARNKYQSGEYTASLEEYMYVLNIDPDNVEARESIDAIWKKMLRKEKNEPVQTGTPGIEVDKIIQETQEQFNKGKYFYFLENYKKIQEEKEKLALDRNFLGPCFYFQTDCSLVSNPHRIRNG